jgi:hypothetical protein
MLQRLTAELELERRSPFNGRAAGLGLERALGALNSSLCLGRLSWVCHQPASERIEGLDYGRAIFEKKRG